MPVRRDETSMKHGSNIFIPTGHIRGADESGKCLSPVKPKLRGKVCLSRMRDTSRFSISAIPALYRSMVAKPSSATLAATCRFSSGDHRPYPREKAAMNSSMYFLRSVNFPTRQSRRKLASMVAVSLRKSMASQVCRVCGPITLWASDREVKHSSMVNSASFATMTKSSTCAPFLSKKCLMLRIPIPSPPRLR